MEALSLKSLEKAELNGLDNKLFKENRSNFLKNLSIRLTNLEKQSIIVMQGGSELPRYDTDVNIFHFIQDSHFYYLTGVREPNFYSILDIHNKEIHLFYILPDESDKTWQYVPSLEELSKKYEVNVFNYSDFYSKMASLNPKKIYVLNGVNSDSTLNIKTVELDFPEQYKILKDKVDTDPLVYEILADTRTRKNKQEIEVMAFASKITVESHINVIKNIKTYKNERDLEANFLAYLSENYYIREFSYPCICGSGSDAATLHYENNDKLLKEGSMILLDMGTRFVGYASDITSTIPINGKFSQRQKQIYDIVLNANRTVMSRLKPGVSWPDMHLLAERTILQGLIDLSLLNKFKLDDMMKKRIGYYFMPHGLGHLIGLDVHDVGGYLSFTPKRSDVLGLKSLRTARVLEENNVITVEPGIYFIPFLLEKAFLNDSISKYFNIDLLKTYFDFGGVRIEDDVIITKDGYINLSRDLPRKTEEIEALINHQ